MITREYLEQSAEKLIDDLEFSTAINSSQIKLLKKLMALRDADILSKAHIDSKEQEEQDTLPPTEDPITLIDNRLE